MYTFIQQGCVKLIKISSKDYFQKRFIFRINTVHKFLLINKSLKHHRPTDLVCMHVSLLSNKMFIFMVVCDTVFNISQNVQLIPKNSHKFLVSFKL